MVCLSQCGNVYRHGECMGFKIEHEEDLDE